MQWVGRRQSTNVEDRRGMPVTGLALGGGGLLGTLAILFLACMLGADPLALLQNVPQQGPGQAGQVKDERREFIAVVLADTEDVWHDQFRKMGKTYREPKLVVFDGQVRSTCGFASAAVGPFYCPGDETIYLDLSFFEDLKTRYGAPGDFAQAYVIAHEVGHHVQKLLGTTARVDSQRGRVSQEQFNQLSVRLELQADFLAGVWAHHAQKMRKILDPGDIEEALGAANAIGDDRLQRKSRGYVVPDSFTHGTSAQRMRWFKRGFDTGDMSKGDTFNAKDL